VPMSPKEMISYLKRNGFVFIRSNGSHHKYFNHATGKTTIIPYHNKSLKPGTENAILKQAGLKKP